MFQKRLDPIECRRQRMLKGNLNKVHRRLRSNGYPSKFVEKVVSNVSFVRRENPDLLTYLKIPYINEKQRFQVLRLAKSTGLNDKIRIIFESPKLLAWLYRGKCETVNSPKSSGSCLTAKLSAIFVERFTLVKLVER